MDSGDRSAGGGLEAALVTHRPMLLNHARSFLGPRREDAQDFVQDTLERFVTSFPQGPPPEPRCAGWLMTTLTHLLISDWRKQVVRRKALSDPAMAHTATPQPVVSLDSVRPPAVVEKVMEKVTPDDFKAAVATLSPKLRPVYELHVLGLSHEEIGSRLGIKAGAARKRLWEARRRLAAHLEMGVLGGDA